jgi:hypothetical protein
MPEIRETPIGRLRKAVIGQKTASLPEPPKDPSLQPLYDLLYEYDQYITQMVINVLQGNLESEDYSQRGQIDLLMSDSVNSLNPMTKRELDLYKNYLLRLDTMLISAKVVVQDRKIKKVNDKK